MTNEHNPANSEQTKIGPKNSNFSNNSLNNPIIGSNNTCEKVKTVPKLG